MKRACTLFSCLPLLLSLAACKTTTTTSEPVTWTNTSYEEPRFAKLYVIAVGEDEETRRLFEDTFARALASEQVVSEPSWKTLPTSEKLTEEQIREAIGDGDFDAVLITFVVDVDSKPPTAADLKTYYNDYDERYVEAHESEFDPNAYYRGETRLYSVKTSDLVWVGQSITGTPSSIKAGLVSYGNEVARALKSQGLVRAGVGQGRTPGSGDEESF